MRAKRKQRQKISTGDVNAIATLIVRRRLTETEACIHLGIHPPSWFNWKAKEQNQVKNSECLARVRAAWVESRCKSIEEVGDGAPGTRRDWRAQSWLLERTLPERFGTQPPPPPIQPAMPSTVNVWISAAYAAQAAGGAVVDTTEAKQIADAPQPEVPAPAEPSKP
jgi:hypothetical protein